MYPLTLLSPARDYATGIAAIQAGADAIYIGGPSFGAREKAGNSVEDIAALCREAAVYGVSVLVTLNTLLSDEERAEAIAMADRLSRVGVEAFIVQDPELMRALVNNGLRVHASTQCDNRTISDVRDRRDRGCRRVVLARELGVGEIRAIHEAVPDVELEAFVHGALCVSYSGRCYMSEVLMGRSANRGACAQMCRQRYDLLDASGREVTDDDGLPIHQRYLLSLQDLDRSMYLNELIEAGVTTFKIEGRLKDPDYVTNVTAYYRRLIDAMGVEKGLQSSSVPSVYTLDFEPNPAKSFHRGGIDYFLHGRTPNMANHQTPKSTGEYIGVVASARADRGAAKSRPHADRWLPVVLEPNITLHNGDGISVGDRGFCVNGVEPDRILCSTRPDARPGDKLYRNSDVEFSRHLRAERRIPVDISLCETETGYRLSIGTHCCELEAEHIPAQNPEKAVQTARAQLSKLGDTPYVARRIDIRTACFIPAGQLNEWRRQTLKSIHA